MRAVLAFLLVLGTFLLRAEAAEPRRIGILYQDPLLITRIEAFQDTLRELGYVEGVTISYDRRMANATDLDDAARILVQSGVDLIVTPGTTAALAVQRATTRIPLIFYGADPVSSGLVKSLAHPGGNVTGIASMASETGTKRVELLKEVLPRMRRVVVLSNPDNPITEVQQKALSQTAQKLAVSLQTISVRNESDLEHALTWLERKRVDAFVIVPDALMTARSTQIAQHALKARIPGIFAYRMFADAGGLMSYGPDFTEVWHRCALYADKILKGAAPSDLPIEQPTKFELVVNLKTAKALGITIPESILLRADEVIR